MGARYTASGCASCRCDERRVVYEWLLLFMTQPHSIPALSTPTHSPLPAIPTPTHPTPNTPYSKQSPLLHTPLPAIPTRNTPHSSNPNSHTPLPTHKTPHSQQSPLPSLPTAALSLELDAENLKGGRT